MKKRAAFTMLELVFVIVIVGILAALGVPKIIATRQDAVISRFTTDVASIRSGISTAYTDNLLKGTPKYPDSLEKPGSSLLFDAVISTGITPRARDGWTKTGANTYNAIGAGLRAVFTYNSTDGTFDCNSVTGSLCSVIR